MARLSTDLELDRLRRLIVYQAEQNRKLAKELAKVKKQLIQQQQRRYGHTLEIGDVVSFTSEGVTVTRPEGT